MIFSKNNQFRPYPQQSRRVFIFFPKCAAKPSAGNPLLNLLLTRPCTKDSQDLLFRNLLRNPLNLTWLYTKTSQNLLRKFLRIPIERVLPLHQSLRDLHRILFRNLLRNFLRNLLRNPIESHLTQHQTLP